MTYTHSVTYRLQDPALLALLAVQLVLIFVAEPLAFNDFAFPLIATGIVVAGLFLLLVLGSHQCGALIVIVIGGVRLLAGVVDLLWRTSLTEGAEAGSAILALLAVTSAVFRIVFSPGHITCIGCAGRLYSISRSPFSSLGFTC